MHVKLRLMRRLSILGLALILIVTGLTPLSACALFTSKPAECAQPAVHSHCDQMPFDDAATRSFTSSGKSCCVVSQAPMPELQYKAAETAAAVTPIVTTVLHAIASVRPTGSLRVSVEEPSPPSLQSLLCTLLI
jgi:hypothetical protein